MGAWIKQLSSQVKKRGAEKASWYVEWDEPDGTRRCKSCGGGRNGKRDAEKLRERIKAELLTGTYNRKREQTWADFRRAYETKVLPGMAIGSVKEVRAALNHFERICKLANKTLAAVTAETIAHFKSIRGQEPGKKPGSQISPATLNNNLRQIRAALNTAAEWKWIESAPKVKEVKAPQSLPRFVTADHFALIYAACDVARFPLYVPYHRADWWRGLLTMAQMTGWRKCELLGLDWQDVDLERGTAITRARVNKGKRDGMIALHPVVIDHLQPLRTLNLSRVFPWKHHERTLYSEFARVQDEAGIHLPCRNQRPHECTAACHRYGFHDERRAFATMNATKHVSRSVASPDASPEPAHNGQIHPDGPRSESGRCESSCPRGPAANHGRLTRQVGMG